jgi:hypothetical protein
MIMNDYMDDMTSAEIISLMSIFTDPIIGSENSINNIGGTSKVRNIIKFIKDNMYDPDWIISGDYVDFSYKWATNITVFEMSKLLASYNEYEGNFVRNMLKIYNICQNLENICKSINKINILPQLEKIPELILRDIVTTVSLYF